MKKVSFIALALLMAASVFAYEQIGQLNPYAYGVSGTAKNGKIAVAYSLNAPADSTIIAIYRDGVEVGTQLISDNAQGLHSAVVDLAPFTAGGVYTVGVRVYKQSYEAPFQLKEILDGSTDTTALNYAFYHPKGVDIDVDPYSEYFGRILTNEAMQDTPDEGYRSSVDKCGIYAFDATFAPIANGNGAAFKGGLEFAVRMSDGSTRAYAPYRVRISKDGRIFASMQDDTRSPLYELSKDLQTWTPIFNGTMVDGVMSDADGNYISGINCGLDVIGEGEDLEIIMLNMNTTGFSSYNGKDWTVAHYKIGTNTVWTGPATKADSLSKFIGEAAVPVAASAGIAWDKNNGFWFHSARANMIDQRGLCHVRAAGTVDFEFHATAADTAKYHLNPNGSNGGAGCRIINLDGDDVLFVGQGRSIGGCGHMQAYKIIYAADGTVSDLDIKYDEHFIGISTNLNDFAVDFGHNLYTVGNSNEKIIPIALPYSGMTETPVAAEVIKEDGLDNVNGEVKAVKMIEDGKVIILKNGVKYDMLGTVVK